MGNCCGKGSVPRDDDKAPYGDHKKQKKSKNSGKNSENITPKVSEKLEETGSDLPAKTETEKPRDHSKCIPEVVIEPPLPDVNKTYQIVADIDAVPTDELTPAESSEVKADNKGDVISSIIDKTSNSISKSEFRKPASQATHKDTKENAQTVSPDSPPSLQDDGPPSLPNVAPPSLVNQSLPTEQKPSETPIGDTQKLTNETTQASSEDSQLPPPLPDISPPGDATPTFPAPSTPVKERPSLPLFHSSEPTSSFEPISSHEPNQSPKPISSVSTPELPDPDSVPSPIASPVLKSSSISITLQNGESTGSKSSSTTSSPLVKHRPTLITFTQNSTVKVSEKVADKVSDNALGPVEKPVVQASRLPVSASPRSSSSGSPVSPVVVSPVSPVVRSASHVATPVSSPSQPVTDATKSSAKKPSKPSGYSRVTAPNSPPVAARDNATHATRAARTRPVSQLLARPVSAAGKPVPAADRSFDDVAVACEGSRDHEMAAVDDWFKNNSHRRPLVVVGKPGVGKTCLLAAVVKQYRSLGLLACSYAFDALDCRRTCLDGALKCLARQCGAQEVKGPGGGVNGGSDDVDEWCSSLMASLPVSLDTEHRLIVLDALDECAQPDRVYALISGLYERAPRQLHVLASVNARCRERLSDVQWLEMKSASGQQHEAVKCVLRPALAEVCERIDLATGLEVVARAAKGSMLCAATFVDRLKVMSGDGKRLALRDAKSSFPNGLGEVLKRVFTDLRAILDIALEEKAGETYARVVGGLALARRPLDIATEFKRLVVSERVNSTALLAELAPAVRVSGHRVSVRHTAVREWLRDPELSGELAVDGPLAERYLAAACLSSCLRTLRGDSCTLEDYAVEHGAWHAVAGGVGGAADAVDEEEVDGESPASAAERMARVVATPEFRLRKLAECGENAYAADVQMLLQERSVHAETRKALKLCEGDRSRCYFDELTRPPRHTPFSSVSFGHDELVLAVEVNDSGQLCALSRKIIRGDNDRGDYDIDREEDDVILRVYDGALERIGGDVIVNRIPGYMSTSPGHLVHPVLCPIGRHVFVGSYEALADPLEASNTDGLLATVRTRMVAPSPNAQDTSSTSSSPSGGVLAAAVAAGYSVETAAYAEDHLVTALNALTHGGRCLRVVVHRYSDGTLLADLEVVRFRFGGSASFGVRCCAVKRRLDGCVAVAACVKHTSKPGVSVYAWCLDDEVRNEVRVEPTRLAGELSSDAFSKCGYLDDSTLLLAGRRPSDRKDADAVLWLTDISDVRPLQHRRAALQSAPSHGLLLADSGTRTTLTCLDAACLDAGATAPDRYRLHGAPAVLNDIISMWHDGEVQSVLVSDREITIYKHNELKLLYDEIAINDLDLLSIAVSKDSIFVTYRDEGNTCSVGELESDGNVRPTVFYREHFTEFSTNTTDKKYFCKSENFVNGGLVLSHDDRFLILNCTQDNIKVWHRTDEDGLYSNLVTLLPSWTAAAMMISEETSDSEESHNKLVTHQRILVSPKEASISIIYYQQPWRIFTFDLLTSGLLRKINLQVMQPISDYIYQTATSNLLTYYKETKLVVFWNSVNGQQKCKENIDLDFGLISPTSDRILLKDVDSVIQLRNADLRFRVYLTIPGNNQLENAAFSLDGTILIGCGNRGNCYIWNAGNGALLRDFDGATSTAVVYGWLNCEHVLLSVGVMAISSGDVVGELTTSTSGAEVNSNSSAEVDNNSSAVVVHGYVCRRRDGVLQVYRAVNVPAASQSSLEYASKQI